MMPNYIKIEILRMLRNKRYRIAGQCSGLQAGGEGPREKTPRHPERPTPGAR
jgi:hypothetical protein